MGVAKVIPMISERTQYSIQDESKNSHKLSRWQKIAISASKQSGRTAVPEIFPIKSFKNAIESLDKDLKTSISLIAWECEEKNKLKDIFLPMTQHRELSDINLFIGPEGGFSDTEIEFAKKNSLIPISLGKRILRTETAPIVMISNIIYELDL